MKKLLIAIVALAIPALASAQNYQAASTASVNVTAAIGQAVTMDKVQDLSIGSFVSGGTQGVATTVGVGAEADVNLGAGAYKGIVTLNGTDGGDVIITITGDDYNVVTRELVLKSGSDELEATLIYGYIAGIGSPTTANYTPGATVALDGDGDGTLEIGAQVADLDVAAGNYSATVVVSAVNL
ncbi:MAG: hypothetical protein LAT57_12500 [Balneolales bacterium]|nr:hypothetical protein [Balneolales bacterium]